MFQKLNSADQFRQTWPSMLCLEMCATPSWLTCYHLVYQDYIRKTDWTNTFTIFHTELGLLSWLSRNNTLGKLKLENSLSYFHTICRIVQCTRNICRNSILCRWSINFLHRYWLFTLLTPTIMMMDKSEKKTAQVASNIICIHEARNSIWEIAIDND